MKVGIVYPQTEMNGNPEAVREIALATESLGYSHLLFYDHVVGASHLDRNPKLSGPYTELDPFHDPFVALSYVSGITTHLELATGVLILPQRQTVLVAKQAADLDLLSGERFRLGVGSGWNYVEYDALGQDFRARGDRMNEQIKFIRQLWSEPLSSFSGTYDSLDRGNINPRPNRAIPIWMGGFSPVAYRRAAEVGDGFIFAGLLEGERGALNSWNNLKDMLKVNDRDEGTFGADIVMLASKTVGETVDAIKRWRDVGGTHASIVTMGMELGPYKAHIDYIAEVKENLDV